MTEGTLGGYDAAWPVGSPPVDDRVVLGYLGGDTPHPWLVTDWASQPARYRVGIWTRSNPQQHAQELGVTTFQLGQQEALTALVSWRNLGAPSGTLLALDYETAVCADYVRGFDAEVVAAGDKVALYGSKSTVFQNPKPSGGYWPADLTGASHLYPGTLITQYKFENDWDDDTVAANAPLWDTHPTDPTPTPRSLNVILLHIDTAAGDRERVFTNPAAAQGGSCTMYLTSDFGVSTVRVATFSFKNEAWTVNEYDVRPTSASQPIPLPADVNKVGVSVSKGDKDWPVGVDVM